MDSAGDRTGLWTCRLLSSVGVLGLLLGASMPAASAPLTGFPLLVLVYYMTGGIYLIDPAVSSERLLYRLFHEEGVRVFLFQLASC